MESAIASVKAREILDSRGTPTVEVDIWTHEGVLGRAAVPSGMSTGRYEAVELRDHDPKIYGGKSVRKAVDNVNERIAPRILGKNVFNQSVLDHFLMDLDGTSDKRNLGANAILGVSLAAAKTAAAALRLPLYRYLGGTQACLLPVPLMNLVNGGVHSDSGLSIQEFLIVPAGAPNFREALRWGAEIYSALKKILRERGFSVSVGDEGGFAPHIQSTEAVLEILMEAVEKAGYKPGIEVAFALDAAATEFYQEGTYRMEGKQLAAKELIGQYKTWCAGFPIISLEDGLAEEDWEGWKELTRQLGEKVQLIGDDLFVTNPARLTRGIREQVANAVLIKLNQIGTVTETTETIELAKRNGYGVIVSHRSGDTEDTSIADLAVGMNSGQIKTGGLSRSERIAKYNQLLRIEEELGDAGRFTGFKNFSRSIPKKEQKSERRAAA